jgi:hypothetical protein
MLLSTIIRPTTLQRVTPIFKQTYRAPLLYLPRTAFHFSSTSTIRYPQDPSKMRAVLIKDGKGPVENLYLGEEATPEPEEGQVQVQVSSILLVVWYKLTSRSK